MFSENIWWLYHTGKTRVRSSVTVLWNLNLSARWMWVVSCTLYCEHHQPTQWAGGWLVRRLPWCAGKEKNLSHAGIKPCVSETESIILAGSYTYRQYISPIKFLKFLIANSSNCVTQTLGHIKVEMNKL